MIRVIPASWLLLSLLASPVTASTWVVDDSGGGDFTSIQAAIDAAQPGDVLRVKAGSYAAFTLDRGLSILGEPGIRPFVAGLSRLQAGQTTGPISIAGLELGSLEVLGASGPVLLDDLEVNGELPAPVGCQGMLIHGCAQVHVARSLIHGKDGDFACESRALRIVDSVVTLTGCTLIGGRGWGDDFIAYDGQEGLDVVGASAVLLSQTSVRGGDGGSPQILFGGTGANGAEAIRMSWGDARGAARCTVRGSDAATLQGGHAGLGIGAQDAFAAVTGFGTLTLSGVTCSPDNFGGGLDVVLPAPSQPFLNLVGGDGPRAFKRLNMQGPAGTPLLLFASLHVAQLSLPGPIDGTVWLDLGAPLLILPLVLQGQPSPVNLTFSLPAALTDWPGLTVVFQGFAAGLGADGQHLATNPAHLLVR